MWQLDNFIIQYIGTPQNRINIILHSVHVLTHIQTDVGILSFLSLRREQERFVEEVGVACLESNVKCASEYVMYVKSKYNYISGCYYYIIIYI